MAENENQWFMSDQEFKDKLSGYLNTVKNRKRKMVNNFKVKDNISLTLFLTMTGVVLIIISALAMLIFIPSFLIILLLLSPIIVLEVIIRELFKRKEKINEDNSKGID